MANAASIRHFVLGLLNRQPMSGYDIRRFLQRLSWLIDSPSFGSLYPALHALLKDDLVTVEVVPCEDRPPRKIYTITEAGKHVLREWMDQPVTSNASLKAFLMRLIPAGNLSHDGLITHLQQRRAQVTAHRRALERTAETMGESIDLGDRLALDYGLTVASAELTWLDRTLFQLSQTALPPQAVRDDLSVPTV
jgi:DNA-binding PadR family transcriptional regulator